MKRTILCLLLAPVAAAQQKTITASFKDQDLQKAVEAVAGPGVEIDQELVRRKVTLEIVKKTPTEALALVAKAAGGAVYKGRVVPLWQAAILEKLDSPQQIDFAIAEEWVAEATHRLRRFTGMNIHVDPEVNFHKFSFRGKLTRRQLLEKIAKVVDGKWELRYGVVFVSSPERLLQLPVMPPELPAALARRRIDVPFQNTPLPNACDYLRAATGIDTVMNEADKEELKAIEIDLCATRLSLPQVCALCFYPNGCRAEFKDGKIVVSLAR